MFDRRTKRMKKRRRKGREKKTKQLAKQTDLLEKSRKNINLTLFFLLLLFVSFEANKEKKNKEQYS